MVAPLFLPDSLKDKNLDSDSHSEAVLSEVVDNDSQSGNQADHSSDTDSNFSIDSSELDTSSSDDLTDYESEFECEVIT